MSEIIERLASWTTARVIARLWLFKRAHMGYFRIEALTQLMLVSFKNEPSRIQAIRSAFIQLSKPDSSLNHQPKERDLTGYCWRAIKPKLRSLSSVAEREMFFVVRVRSSSPRQSTTTELSDWNFIFFSVLRRSCEPVHRPSDSESVSRSLSKGIPERRF